MHNRNIATTLVQRVPCIAAKAVDKGFGIGTHAVTLMLDLDSNILFLSCECEQDNGELHSEASLDLGANTCFAVVKALRRFIKSKDMVGLSVFRAGNQKNTEHLLNSMKLVQAGIDKKRVNRYERENTSVQYRYEDPLRWKALALTRVIDRALTAVPVPVEIQASEAERVALGAPPLRQGLFQVTPVQPTEDSDMRLSVVYCGVDGSYRYWRDIAVRIHGTWEESASDNIADISKKSVFSSSASASSDKHLRAGYCAVCNAMFTRMSKHTGGGKHATALTELIRKVKGLTSREGLKSQTWIKRKQMEQRMGIWTP